MFLVLALQTLLTIQKLVAAQPVREVTSQAMLFGGQSIPGFYDGYLMIIHPSHRNYISVYSPEGQLLFEKDIQPGIALSVSSMAVDTDGTVAVSWGGFEQSGRRCAGISLLDRNGTQRQSVSNGYYVTRHLAFDEDHSLWTLGWERDSHDPERAASDYMTIRKYLKGQETAAYLPRSSFSHGLEPSSCLAWQERGITIARDRIGVYACSGRTSENREWIELDLSGKLLGRWKVEGDRRLAMTHDGHVYARSAITNNQPLFVLDRASSTFKPVPWTNAGILYGADRDDLVFFDSSISGPMHLSWFKQP